MSDATLHFDLVSPERKLMSEPVKQVTCPGEEGDFGVLPGHAPLVAGLRAGVITVTFDGDERQIFIAGGFADVSETQVTVLAEEAVAISDLDANVLDGEIKVLQEDIKLAGSDADARRLQRSLAIAEAKRALAAA